MYHFCTYFDSNYLLRGMTLYRSLEQYCREPFRFYVLCLDLQTFDVLERLENENIVPIALTDVEQWDAELLVAKGNRILIEYYFTLSPVLPLYVLDHFDMDVITYLDADLMFFSSPKSIYDELGDRSIFITEHRFSEKLKDSEKFGKYNVQCQAFRNDEQGKKCLNRWRMQCLEYCYDRLEDGKFADQKYLDEWPELYDHLTVGENLGIGCAPWNVDNDIGLSIKQGDLHTYSGPVVFYHFHGFKDLSYSIFAKSLYPYHVRATQEINYLYRQYAYALRATDRFLQQQCAGMEENQSAISIQRFGFGKWRVFLASLRRGDILFVS